MAVLFCWENRRNDRLTLENLKLATELPELELRRTLGGLVASQRLRKQLLQHFPLAQSPRDFTEQTVFWINHDFALVKNGKVGIEFLCNLLLRELYISRIFFGARFFRQTSTERIVKVTRSQLGIGLGNSWNRI